MYCFCVGAKDPAQPGLSPRGPGHPRAGTVAGHLADRIGRKPPIVAGMLIQAAGLAVITIGISHALAAGLTRGLPARYRHRPGLPHPAGRGQRRDPPRLAGDRAWHLPVLARSGYAIGALIGGITATLVSLDTAIGVATVLTAASGILAWAFMKETHRQPQAERARRPSLTGRPWTSAEPAAGAAGRDRRRPDQRAVSSATPQAVLIHLPAARSGKLRIARARRRRQARTAPEPGLTRGDPIPGSRTAGACHGQQQSSPCQDRMPSRTATAAMPRPMTGSIHQPPGQAAVTARPTSTAAACAAHR